MMNLDLKDLTRTVYFVSVSLEEKSLDSEQKLRLKLKALEFRFSRF